MKKIFIPLIAIVLIFLFFIFRDGDSEVTNIDSNGTAIIAFGNSLVFGVGSEGGGDFVTLLSDRLGEDIINKGVSGNTTLDGLKRIDEVIALNPKIVILLLGGNDAIRKISIEETFGNLSKLIESIHNGGSSVLLVGVQSGILRDRFKKEYEKLSKEYNTAYIPDILDGIFGNSKFMSDLIHPNNEGYILIADKIEPVLRELLDR